MNINEFYADIPGGQLYIKKWTPENPIVSSPIVLMHDSLGCVALWRNFPEQLANALSCVVIAYDRLGFGLSSANESEPNFNFIEDEADLYFPYVKAMAKFESYYLFGHSVGGSMAISTAAVDNDCLAVVTESAQSFVENLTVEGIQEAKILFKQPGQMERLKKWHQEKAEWVLKAWIDIWLSQEFASWTLEPRLEKVTCPVLAIHGDKDEYGSKAFPEFISTKTLGKSEMVLLENCGHVPHKEMKDEVLKHTKAFFEKHRLV